MDAVNTLKTYRLPILITLAFLLLIGGFLAAVRHYGQQKEVQKVKEKGTELAADSTQRLAKLMDQARSKSFSPASFFASQDEQRERWQEFREEVAKLPPDMRREAMQDMGKMFVKQIDKMAADLMAKPKQEQDMLLDAFIDIMEMGRKRMGGGPGAGGAGQGRPPASSEERERRGREFLDNTLPVERARMSEGMRLMNQRREERGLSPMQFGR